MTESRSEHLRESVLTHWRLIPQKSSWPIYNCSEILTIVYVCLSFSFIGRIVTLISIYVNYYAQYLTMTLRYLTQAKL